MAKKKQSKNDKKLQAELFDFLKEAIRHANANNVPKPQLAAWLHTKNIAMKQMVINKDTFVPHIQVEYNDNGKLKEFVFDLTELEGRTAEEIITEIQNAQIPN